MQEDISKYLPKCDAKYSSSPFLLHSKKEQVWFLSQKIFQSNLKVHESGDFGRSLLLLSQDIQR